MRAHEFITEHRLVFKKNPKSGNITMKWRCESGPRKGRTVPDVAQCSAPPDIKKAAKMKQTRKRTKVAQARKTKKTKRVNPMTKTATRLNKASKRHHLREEITTINNIYKGDYPSKTDHFWYAVPSMILDDEFEIHTLSPFKARILLTGYYQVEHIDEIVDLLKPEQKEVLNHYINSDLSQEIIILAGNRIIDGNHRALAAALSNQPIKYINIEEQE